LKKLLLIGLVLLLILTFLVSGCGADVASPPENKQSTAVRLVFTRQPSDAISGIPFDSQPVVKVEDEQGNIVTDYMGYVELSINAGTEGAKIFGGTRLVAKNGVVEFENLFIDKSGTDYTLIAKSKNLGPAVSTAFSITTGAPAALKFSVQPSGAIAGEPLGRQPEVIVKDFYGNRVTDYEGSVTMSVTPIPELITPDLHGTTTVKMIDGVARFTGLSIQRSFFAFTLTARSEGLDLATSWEFRISPAEPVELEVTVHPDGAVAGQPFEIQPKVAIVDLYGNVVASSTAAVTLEIVQGTGTSGATLKGETTIEAFDGLCIFRKLYIDLPGTNYILGATSSGLAPDVSRAFDVASP